MPSHFQTALLMSDQQSLASKIILFSREQDALVMCPFELRHGSTQEQVLAAHKNQGDDPR